MILGRVGLSTRYSLGMVLLEMEELRRWERRFLD
jgi:hypothetical protein